MTVPIAPDSPRRAQASAFARELRRAMTARGASAQRLSEAAGVAKSAIGTWKAGLNIPYPATAARLAEVLDWPKLTALATEARSKVCARCGRSFVDLAGRSAKRYCSPECRLVDAQLRSPKAGASLYAAVRAATESRLAGEAEAVTLPAILGALREYGEGEARRVSRVDAQARQVAGLHQAIDAMCAACEPEGLCRTAECPLRAFSPLSLADDRAPSELRAPSSPHAPENKDRWLAAVRAGNAERWSREGERERQSESSIARWAAMDPDEREAVGARISAGRRLA